MSLHCIFYTLCLIHSITSQTHNFGKEYNLIASTLLQGYDKTVNDGSMREVQLKFHLNQIVQVDEKLQTMTTSSIIELAWTDSRLAFANSSHTTNEVLVSATSLWLPDISVVNTATSNSFVQVSAQNMASVSASGQVRLLLDLSGLQTRCQLEYFKFPYDIQNCSIRLGSWQDQFDFDSDDDDIDTSYAMENQIFHLDKATVQSAPARFRKATDIIFKLTLSRRSKNYILNNILPTFVLTVIALLLFCFPFNLQVLISRPVFITYSIHFNF